MAFDLDTATNAEITQAIYIAYYGRAAEDAGFAFWTGEAARLAGEGASNIDIAVNFASRFADVEESQARYPFLSDPTVAGAETFVNNVYQALFARDADADGLDFYSQRVVNQLDAGEPIGDIVLDILAGARDSDAQILENRATTAQAYTDAHRAFDLSYATDDSRRAIDAVSGEQTPEQARQTGFDRASDNLAAAGTDGDFVSLRAFDDFTGSAANDFINALGVELQAGDRIDGDGGVDRLNWLLTDANETTAVNLVDLEWVYLTNTAQEAVEVDAEGWSDVERLWNTDSTEALTISNLDAVPGVGLSGTGVGTTLRLDTARVDGDQDRLSVFAETAGSVGARASLTVTDEAGQASVIEGLSVTAVGSNHLDLSGVGSGVRRLEVDGPGRANLLVDSASLTQVDASASEGGLALSVGGVGNDLNVRLSSAEGVSDAIVVRSGLDGEMTVDNFDPTQGDTLDLSGLGVTGLPDLTLEADEAGVTVFSNSFNGSIALTGMKAAELGSDAFLFV